MRHKILNSVIFILLFQASYLFAWSGPDTLTTDIPEKWKDESAVVIYQEFTYHYQASARSVDYREQTKRRIKLLDKAAVEEFSEFSFSERFRVTKGFSRKGGRASAEIKVVKANGAEMKIDMKDAVEVKNDAREQLKKIAIPNLEPGDIIDYSYEITEPFVSVQEYTFDPIISTLHSSYPVMKQKISFEVGKNFFINFRSVNGAPALKVEDDSQRKTTIYSLVDTDREKEEDLRWFYPNRELPTIKFQVVFARKKRMEKAADVFLGEKGEVKNEVGQNEVRKYYAQRLDFSTRQKSLEKHIKESGAKTELEKIKAAYYFFRYYGLLDEVEAITLYQEGVVETINFYRYGFMYSELGFVNRMGAFLQSQDIDFEVLAAVPRQYSSLEDLLLSDEIRLVIRVDLQQSLYLSIFSLHSNFDELPASLEGADAYVIMGTKTDGKTNTRIPVSSYERNKTITRADVSIDMDNKKLIVKRDLEEHGHNRRSLQHKLIDLYDYITDEYKQYKEASYLEVTDMKKKAKMALSEKISAKREQDRTEQKENFRKQAESELDIELPDYTDYRVHSMGRTAEDPVLRYTESFETSEWIKKAGPNWIIEAGKFIGGQVALESEEMSRRYDVHMPHARSYHDEILIRIPEGYTVSGLEKFEKNLENESGGFVSSAQLEGNLVRIKTHKFYKNNYEPAANWPNLVSFLELAYDFSQEKLLIKKK